VFDFPGWIGINNQTALFMMPAAVIVSVKIRAFFSGCGYSHLSLVVQNGRLAIRSLPMVDPYQSVNLN
jgi:hypothetical protein